MPLVKIGNNTCYYRLDGHADRPVLILSHSLGLDHGMWDAQAADLLPRDPAPASSSPAALVEKLRAKQLCGAEVVFRDVDAAQHVAVDHAHDFGNG